MAKRKRLRAAIRDISGGGSASGGFLWLANACVVPFVLHGAVEMRTSELFLAIQNTSATLWAVGGALLFVILLGGTWMVFFAVRHMLRGGSSPKGEAWEHQPSTNNPSAFMTASMQAVIQKLRDQEKELA